MTATMKKIIILFAFLSTGRLVETIAQTPTTGKNAIMEKTPREAMTTLTGATHTTVQTAIRYFDGLGRPTQTVLYRASPDATKDIVASSTEYDGFGNPYKNILPTPSDVATGAYSTTVQTLATSFYNDTHPYQQSVLEKSPLNRVVETFGAGQAWRVLNNEKSTKITYGAAGNEILEFSLKSNGDVDVLGSYGGSSLYVQTITSERGFRTNEYKDRLGRVVAKSQELTKDVFAITGFIYDDLNRLRIVVQPKAYKTVSTMTSFTLDSTVCKEGMFYYLYDSRGRVAEKRVPGGGTIRYIYDKNDRVVLENDDRDANIPSPGTNYYKFTKYDILGRIIQTGLIFGIGSFSRSQLQKDFDDFADVSTNIIYEERGTDLEGYTNRSFPANYTPQNSNLRTVTYYDDYGWQTDANYSFKTAQAFHTQANTKGMITGSLVRNLETNVWYKYVNFYDYLGRIIQQFAQNNVGGIDRSDHQYRFNGDVLKMRMTHQKTSVSDLVELYQYSYDHAGRKTSFTHNSTVVARYQYDDIGRLSSKRNRPAGTALISSQTGNWNTSTTWQSGVSPLANDNVTINAGNTVTIANGDIASAGTLNDNGTLLNFGTLNMGKSPIADLFVQNFSYHIRGGLRGENLDSNGNLTNALFSLKLGYEDANYFDGNIGKQEWKSNIDNISRSYTYSYDGSSRITGGLYAGNGTENYSLNSVSYDANGNIKTLSRNGWRSDNTFGVVDNLDYTYLPNSNKIEKVDDLENETASFTDVAGNDYTYSQDGSLASDANKGITIEYNYLKRPKKITFANNQTIEYQYDANGIKLREKDKSGVWTDYVGNKIYKNGVLYQISHDEGRINTQGEYEYVIQDHLGNVRVMFRDSLGVAKITQSENFGAWGESLSKLNYYRINTNKQQFVYTGHERNEELGIFDAKARFYDPIVPRFWQQDILADKFRRFSPYNYSIGNPLRFIDPTGNSVESIEGGVRFTGEDIRSAFLVLTSQVRNIYIDISKDNQESKYLKNWVGFRVSNLSLAYDAINALGVQNKSLNNLVIQAHGVIDPTSGRTSIKADDNRNEKITMHYLEQYNLEGGVIPGHLIEEKNISMLQALMNKVKDQGNCILGICNLGNPSTIKRSSMGLTDLSNCSLNLYVYNGWCNAPSVKKQISMGSLSAFRENAKYGVTGYWTGYNSQGGVTGVYKDIIINDSKNPIEFIK
jgi:RHS repeat-associated protein